jgi:hypothetical protein
MKRFFTFFTLAFAIQHSANSAVVYSGLQNIPIPTTFDGFYLNLDNATTSTSTILGWDINPFFGGVGLANSPSFQPARIGTDNSDPVIRIYSGDLVSNALNFSSGFGGSGDPLPHLGAGANQFTSGQEGYLGFRWTSDSASGPYYGWMRVTFTNNTSGGFVHDWAYEDTGAPITVGLAIPEPSRIVLTTLALFTLCLRRRRAEPFLLRGEIETPQNR